MNSLMRITTAVIVSAAVLAPGLAEARSHRHHHYAYRSDEHRLPYAISYLHNYGPGYVPGSFAYYDGPSTNRCYQSSATYLGQDHRRHPCF
jgi:hypothetical protein